MRAIRRRWQDIVLGLVALYALTAGVLLATRGVINSDELMHFAVVNKDTALGALADSWHQTHPPLYLMILHFFLGLTADIVPWRLLSVGANVGAGLYLFAWLARLSDKTCALVGTALFFTLPSTLWLAGQVRGYALFLLFLCAWLYHLFRALAERERRPFRRHALAAAVWWALAAFTHYGAVIPSAAGLVALVAASRHRVLAPGSLRFIVVAHTPPMIAFAAYLAIHLPKIGRLDGYRDQFLASFFPADGEGWLDFVWRATRVLFSGFTDVAHAGWADEPNRIGDALFLVTVAATTVMAWRRRPAVWPLLAPFVAGAALAALRLYPYGGSRHSIGLLPFTCALIACAAASLPARARRSVCVIALAIGPGWTTYLTPVKRTTLAFLDRDAEEAFAEKVRSTLPFDAKLVLSFEDEFYFRYLVTDPRRTLDHDISLREIPGRAPLPPYEVFSNGWGRSPDLCKELAAARTHLPTLGASFWLVVFAYKLQRTAHAAPFVESHRDTRRGLLRFETGPALDSYLATSCR